jgi:hypothetical protein
VAAVNIRFTVKDANRSLIAAIGGILGQEAMSGMSALTYAAGYMVKCTARQKTTRGATMVNLRFNVTSAGRKAFARAVGEILGCEVAYLGTPSFAYAAGAYRIDREGMLICPADADCEEADRLIAGLAVRGYEVDKTHDYYALRMTEREELGLGRDLPGEDGPQASDVPEPDDDNKLVIEMPIEGFPAYAYANLGNIIASKSRLIMKALGTDSLKIDVDDEKLRFPWFTITGTDGEMDAYLRFVTALCQMAKNLQRVTAKEKEIENDKFAMRLFLIRLGFVGPELKAARKILLRNLSGNTAWKHGQRSETAAETDAGGDAVEDTPHEK